jgi:hypothetical protein
MTDNRYAPPAAHVEDVQTAVDEAPALWNPGAAAAWSLLFSPVFGALLQMKNWQALGDAQKAATSKTWAGLSLAFMIGLVLLGAFLPESKALDQFSRIAGLAFLLAWYFSHGKLQVAHVKQRFGKTYPRRGWGKPLGYALLVIFGIFAVVFVVAFVVEFFFTP